MPDDMRNLEISMHKIPVGSSLGAAVLIAILLLGMLMDLPGLRVVALGGIAMGLLFGFALIHWRRRGSAWRISGNNS